MNGLKLHKGTALVEVSDPLLLTEIENDAVLKPYVGARISPRHLAVDPRAVAEVTNRLKALGHMPRVVETSPVVAE